MCLHFPCRLSSSSFSSTFSVSFCLFCFIKSLHYAISNVSNAWATSQTCGLQPLPGQCNFTSGVMLNFSAPKSFMWLLSKLQFYFVLSFKHKLGLYTMFNTGFIKASQGNHANCLQLSDSLVSVLSTHINMLPFLYSYIPPPHTLWLHIKHT